MSDLTRQVADARTAPAAAPIVDVAAMTDGQLLADCGNRPDYYAEFYRRHSRSVLAFLMRRTGCAQTAADLASETFAAALAGRGSFRADVGGALPWLYGIARNQLGKYLRKERISRKYQKRLAMRTPTLTDGEVTRVEELADMAALRGRIADAMRALPAGQAQAVQLRIVEQRSYAEVAEAIGTSEGAARVRVSRGLTRLAEILEDAR